MKDDFNQSESVMALACLSAGPSFILRSSTAVWRLCLVSAPVLSCGFTISQESFLAVVLPAKMIAAESYKSFVLYPET